MRHARLEVVRVHTWLSAERQRRALTQAETDELAAAERRIATLRKQAERAATSARNRLETLRSDLARLAAAGFAGDTAAAVAAFAPTDPEVQRVRDMVLDALGDEAPSAVLRRRQAEVDEAAIPLSKHLNPWLDEDAPGRHPPGDARVDRPGDTGHGTAVAGCIVAVAPDVRIMALRAIPDGDELDPDVAEAVRYAVANGARVINCSFAKDWSPQRAVVDAAFAAAEAKGVLVVRSAGNDGESLDGQPSFPARRPAGRPAWNNWLVVGASTAKGDRIVADFSDFGAQTVDLFAPGEDLAVLAEGGGTVIEDGTSFSAPLVAGTAALIWSRWPDLTASQVVDAIAGSVRQPAGKALRPGSSKRTPVADLCRTGGLLDAAAALRRAATLGTRPDAGAR
jgi:subtilisin family serine protease